MYTIKLHVYNTLWLMSAIEQLILDKCGFQWIPQDDVLIITSRNFYPIGRLGGIVEGAYEII